MHGTKVHVASTTIELGDILPSGTKECYAPAIPEATVEVSYIDLHGGTHRFDGDCYINTSDDQGKITFTFVGDSPPEVVEGLYGWPLH